MWSSPGRQRAKLPAQLPLTARWRSTHHVWVLRRHNKGMHSLAAVGLRQSLAERSQACVGRRGCRRWCSWRGGGGRRHHRHASRLVPAARCGGRVDRMPCRGLYGSGVGPLTGQWRAKGGAENNQARLETGSTRLQHSIEAHLEDVQLCVAPRAAPCTDTRGGQAGFSSARQHLERWQRVIKIRVWPVPGDKAVQNTGWRLQLAVSACCENLSSCLGNACSILALAAFIDPFITSSIRLPCL